jgi:uncharacterized protein HemX
MTEVEMPDCDDDDDNEEFRRQCEQIKSDSIRGWDDKTKKGMNQLMAGVAVFILLAMGAIVWMAMQAEGTG